ncbi:hypothetical protein ACH4TX_15780 [Streptomyces sp. NPDC021098]|uniref:hypothetical protein n=1 Tax=unclassified Streptomyces TaxID=2593676 RepID=UPI0037BC6DB5
MYFAFVDDSARERDLVPRAGLGSLHAYGAVVFPAEALQPFRQDLAALRADLGVPAGTEFKWSPDGGPLHKRWNDLHTARLRMLESAAKLKVRATVVVCAPDLMPAAMTETELKSMMLRYLYERVTYVLGRGGQGVMIADQPGGGRPDETRWLADALALDVDGTQYVRPEDKQVLLPIITTRSDHVDHLQLADLVASCATALIAGARRSERYREQLYRLLAKNFRDLTCGAGVKFAPSTLHNPNSLMNLAHWVFGEDAYVLPESSSILGYTLPSSQWKYGSESGLPHSSEEMQRAGE